MSDFSTVPAEAKVLDQKYVMPTYGRLPVEFVRGAGAVLTDSAGNDYIDFLGGIGCASLGHAHPKVAAALKEQVDKVWQVGNYYYVENRGELANGLSTLLSRITDETGHETGSTGTHWKTFFTNSGAEANEGAIKLARRWGEVNLDGAYGVVSAKKSFHGRTLATLAATGQDVFHKTFRPMPLGFDSVELNDIDALRSAVENPSEQCGPVCAVMLECVQGEGGVWPADYDYLCAVRELCDEYGFMLIIDEVQTGFYRCGAPFCFQRSGIVPDIVSMAKGIADGFPMGAFAARAEVADLLRPGDHGSTFGGNALAVAAARATVDALRDEEIGEHVIAVGKHLRHRLQVMDHVTEVRGRGLLRGAQLDVPVANELVDEGLACGLVLNHIGDSIIRFLPPLVITREQIDEGMDRFEALLAKH
ncbi:acetylornithine/succinylornithine family transaminase [Paratractidigestivibacter sp.]|uniref:acetylornithine/succinylornithine family transaminase n=1 Tax=Paratractidigestivibacter sp. TaxID=2847316 RepID=UPI002AC900D0|nr:acetylornithine/succinylornithine family transaminase [Paratractidigestivibacter sp.]